MFPLAQEQGYVDLIDCFYQFLNGLTFKDVKSSIAKCSSLKVNCIF